MGKASYDSGLVDNPVASNYSFNLFRFLHLAAKTPLRVATLLKTSTENLMKLVARLRRTGPA